MILILFLSLFICFVAFKYWKYHSSFPNPVPWPLPFVGHTMELRTVDRWENKFLEWKNKHGKIFTFVLGTRPVIAINDYDTIIEMFVRDGDSYADKLTNKSFVELTRRGNYGIIDTSGILWSKQRRFALKTLRDFGLGKNQMQTLILEEIKDMFDRVNKDIDIFEHDFHKHTDLAVGSVINNITNGYRFTTNGKEKEFYDLKSTINKMAKLFSDPIVGVAVRVPFLRNFPPFKPRFEASVGCINKIFDFIDTVIDQHVKQNDYKTMSDPSDFIDAFMIEKAKADEMDEEHYFSLDQLRSVVMDLWFAGQETSSNTLTWAIAYLICDQEAQKKLHEELDSVIGCDRMITVSDKHSLHYVQAVVLETQRCASIISINTLRATTKELTIEGHKIPRNTPVIAQIGTLMYDPELFPEPSKFKPERFINENGQFESDSRIMPFSIGKRQCPGEGLAKMELFLFIANIFNQYKITSGKELPSLKKAFNGGSLGIESYKCKLEHRFK